MPQLLVNFGDNNAMFLTNLQQCKPEWMKRGSQHEICMISANYSCVICKLLFDTTTELKVHILNAHENDYSCLQCRVKFGTYQELLAHKLTFCKYPVLLTECIWCIKPSSECVCAKIQPFVTETLQEHVRGRIDCKIISNNMFSVLFVYACEKGTLKASNPKF